jgi:hypothetical protein
MDELDQDDVGRTDVDEQVPVVPDAIDEHPVATGEGPEARPAEVESAADASEEPADEPADEPAETPEEEPADEPALSDEAAMGQESMSFDDIVATAAAEAAVDVTGDAAAVTDESAAEATAEAAPSEDLDDMVEALKEGAAAKAAEGEGEPEGEAAVAETVDDEEIAEETQSEDEALEEIEDEFAGEALVRNRLGARLPAWIYAGVWVVFVGVMVYLLWPVASKSFVNQPYYAYLVIGGLVLAVAGPLTALGTWLFARMGTTASERIGLARAVWMRCMLATVFGVSVWWIALFALDLHRTGVIG